jgi:hypothetical protein
MSAGSVPAPRALFVRGARREGNILERKREACRYFITGTRSYLLMDYSAETSEPSQFNRFVGSFESLKPPKSESISRSMHSLLRPLS